jgi:aminoglycoside phosphotransferase (APT) family kinase protein
MPAIAFSTRDQLSAFLERRAPAGATITVGDPSPMFGGWNSSMASFDADLDGAVRRLVLRGELPADKQVAVNHLEREWEVMQALVNPDEPLAPAALHFDRDGSELGAPAVIVEFVEGSSLQAAAFAASPEAQETLVVELARLAARIHAVPLESLPTSLQPALSWDSYVDERIAAFAEIEASWIERDPVLRYAAATLPAHCPPAVPLTLVHGDFHTSNTIVLHSGRQLAVDWQFAHVGDPREDLGWTMIYESVAPPPLVTAQQEEFCAAYREATGLGEDLVNPRILKWFALLCLPRILAATASSAASLLRGRNTSLTLASALALGAVPRRFCLDAIRELEAG